MTRLPSWQDFGTHDESAYPELWRGCVGAWAPCLGPTGTRLHDLSRYRNWGTLTNMDAATDWVVSRGGYAIDLDGSNDFVLLAASNLPSGESPWTISLWEFPYGFGVGNFGTSISWGTTGGVSFESVILANNGTAGNGTILIGQYGRNVLTTTTARPLNTWTHTAITYGGGTSLNAYQNGVPNGTGAINAFAITLTAASIGRLQEGGQHYNGGIADVRVYNRALSPAEIRLLATRRGIAYERRKRRQLYFPRTSSLRRKLLTGQT